MPAGYQCDTCFDSLLGRKHRDRPTRQANHPGTHPNEARKDAKCGGLTRAVCAKHAHDLACLNPETHPMQDLHCPIRGPQPSGRQQRTGKAGQTSECRSQDSPYERTEHEGGL